MKLVLPFSKSDYNLLLLVFTTHFFILLIDSAFWDGMQVISHLNNGEFELLRHEFLYLKGAPIGYYFHRSFGFFMNIEFMYNLSALFSIVFGSLCCKKYLESTRLADSKNALLIAYICFSFPAVHVLFEVIILPYVFFYMLFWIGMYLTRNYSNQDEKNTTLQILGFLFIFLSFQINVLILIYLSFQLYFIFTQKQYLSWRLTLRSNLVPLLIVFLYVIFDKVLFPANMEYNLIKEVDIGNIGLRALKFMRYIIIEAPLYSIIIILLLTGGASS